jgi:predicted Rossmann fold nucleotide-binding protein DprA/Smf involved in DNA uptake
MLSRAKVLGRLDAVPVSPAILADSFGCTVEAMEKVLAQLQRLGAASETAGRWTRAAASMIDD